jgi:hypothetical protein
MDKILEAYLADFAEDFNLRTDDRSTLFEHFVSYCAVGTELPGHFDPAEVHVGGSHDLALDGIAIIVNDHLVTETEQLEDVANLRGGLTVSLVFTQAKTSAAFNGAEIGSFFYGVREILKNDSAAPANDEIKLRRELIEQLFEKSIHFNRNPELRLVYATTGEWVGDAALQARADTEVAQLRALNLFSSITFTPLDATALRSRYQQQKRRLVQEILFERHRGLPQIAGVDVAYIGTLAVTEYLKLVTRSDGRLNRSVFYENIRDYQGATTVNDKIRETLVTLSSQALLPILNNGVTIVARKVEPFGDRFRISDFQVVNGCQTSHELYYARKDISAEVHIPVKLIATQDAEITARIIEATNSQTEIKREAFIALLPFHRKLEEFYAAVGKDRQAPLHYERRSRQYDGTSVRSYQVITVAAQVAAFTAVFLEQPQSCHRYYGELISASRERLFLDDHSPFPYFISSFILYRIEGFFRMHEIPAFLRPLRYHIAMVVRRRAGGILSPSMASKKMDAYCERVLAKLSDNAASLSVIEQACDLVKAALVSHGMSAREASRVRSFTQALL